VSDPLSFDSLWAASAPPPPAGRPDAPLSFDALWRAAGATGPRAAGTLLAARAPSPQRPRPPAVPHPGLFRLGETPAPFASDDDISGAFDAALSGQGWRSPLVPSPQRPRPPAEVSGSLSPIGVRPQTEDDLPVPLNVVAGFDHDAEINAAQRGPLVSGTLPPEVVRPPSLGPGTTRVRHGYLVYDSHTLGSDGKPATHRVDSVRALLRPGESVEALEKRVLERSDFGPEVNRINSDMNALEPTVSARAHALLAEARASGVSLAVGETRRSDERQQYLFQQGRSRPGSPVTWTLTSNHRDGRALDLTGNPRALAWVQANAGRFGFQTLGAMDPGHIESPAPGAPQSRAPELSLTSEDLRPVSPLNHARSAVAQGLTGLADATYRTARGLALAEPTMARHAFPAVSQAVDAVAASLGRGSPIDAVAETEQRWAEGGQQSADEMSTGIGDARWARTAGDMVSTGAQTVLGGEGVGGVLKAGALGSGVADLLAKGAQGGYAARVAAQALPYLPVDAAMGAMNAPQGERLGGAAVNVGLGLAGAGALEGLATGARAAYRGLSAMSRARAVGEDVARGIREATSESGFGGPLDAATHPTDGGVPMPPPPLRPLATLTDPLSARAAALRRANALVKADADRVAAMQQEASRLARGYFPEQNAPGRVVGIGEDRPLRTARVFPAAQLQAELIVHPSGPFFKPKSTPPLLIEGAEGYRPRRGSVPEDGTPAGHALKPAEARVAQIADARRRRAFLPAQGDVLRDLTDIDRIVRPHADPGKESLHVFLTDDPGNILSHSLESSDDVNAVTHEAARFSEMIADRARRVGATRAVFAHNHPNGDATPSAADLNHVRAMAQRLEGLGGPQVDGSYIIGDPGGTFITADGRRLGFPSVKTPTPLPPADLSAELDALHRPDRLTVLYADVKGNPVAFSHHRLEAAATLRTWLPQQMRATRAVTAVVGTPPGAHFSDLTAGVNELRRSGTANVADVVGYRTDGERVSSAEAGWLHPQTIGPARYAKTLGGSEPAVLHSLAGAGVGAGAGGTLDDEHPVRGAVLGGLAGAAGGAVLGRARARPAAVAAGVPAYMADPVVAKVAGSVAGAGAEPGFLGRLTAALSNPGEAAHAAYTKVLDELHPGREFGRKLGSGERLSNQMEQSKGAATMAEQRVRDGLLPVVEAARGNEQGVLALTKAQRALELLDNGYDKAAEFSRDELQHTVDTLSQVPEVRATADGLTGFYRDLLDQKLTEGVLTADQHAKIVASGEHYIPFLRDLEESGGGAGSGMSRFGSRALGSGVASMKDKTVEGLATVDPFEQAVLAAHETWSRIGRQRVTNLVSQVVEADPVGAEALGVRKVASPFAAGKAAEGRVLAATLPSGARGYYAVDDPGLWAAWQGTPAAHQGALMAVLRRLKNAQRVGVTTLPDFAAANGIRDAMFATLKYPWQQTLKASAAGAGAGAGVGAGVGAYESPDDRMGGALRGGAVGAGLGAGLGGFTPQLARMLSALRGIVGNSAGYQQFLRDGGAGFGFYPRSRGDAAKMIAVMRSTHPRFSPSDIINPKSWWHALAYVNAAVEEATRYGRYTYLRNLGADAPAAIAGARDVSVNFSNLGASRSVKNVSQMAAFWNSRLQGTDNLVRTLKNPRSWAIGVATMTAPSVALWELNKDREDYRETPTWEKNTFWLVPKGADDGSAEGRPSSGFYRIPKPFEPGMLFASLPERLLDYAHRQDPQRLRAALRDMGLSVLDGYLPIPTGVRPEMENLANYNAFTGRPVVGRNEERLAPEEQANEHTSFVAKVAGGVLGRLPVVGAAEFAPEKVDNLFRGHLGTAGTQAVDLVDRVARKSGLDDRAPDLFQKAPLLGRFETSEDAAQSESVELFYRRLGEAGQAQAKVQQLRQQGRDDELDGYIADHERDLADYDALSAYAAALGKLRAARALVSNSRDIPDDEKRAQLQELGHDMTALAAEAIAAPTGRSP
jgi:hypothetical protein